MVERYNPPFLEVSFPIPSSVVTTSRKILIHIVYSIIHMAQQQKEKLALVCRRFERGSFLALKAMDQPIPLAFPMQLRYISILYKTHDTYAI